MGCQGSNPCVFRVFAQLQIPDLGVKLGAAISCPESITAPVSQLPFKCSKPTKKDFLKQFYRALKVNEGTGHRKGP